MGDAHTFFEWKKPKNKDIPLNRDNFESIQFNVFYILFFHFEALHVNVPQKQLILILKK